MEHNEIVWLQTPKFWNYCVIKSFYVRILIDITYTLDLCGPVCHFTALPTSLIARYEIYQNIR